MNKEKKSDIGLACRQNVLSSAKYATKHEN